MRIGMMSAAHLHADSYIQNLSAISDVELIGLADDDAGRGQNFSAQFKTRYLPGYDALLREKPDGVVVCSENSRHRELVEMAAAAGGAYTPCEKTPAPTPEEGPRHRGARGAA